MKFGKQIRFVAVKAWYDHYFPYKELKKSIKEYRNSIESATSDETLHEHRQQISQQFTASVYAALNKIVTFYVNKYVEKEDEIRSIMGDIEDQLDTGIPSDEVEKRIHKQIYGSMLELYELRTYIEVNRTGGQKIMKKFMRLMNDDSIMSDYKTSERELFDTLPEITKLMHELENAYVIVKREISPTSTKKSRPEIIVELHTSIENALIWKQSTVLAKFEAATFRHNELLLKSTPMKIWPLVIATVFLVICQCWQWTEKIPYRAQRCIGIVGFAAIMWATSAVPLWLTSLSVPLLGIVTHIMNLSDVSFSAIGKVMQQSMMSPTVFLTIGGFTIAAALRETEMDKRLATVVLQKASSNRRVFLLVLIILNAFIAMWISNITSTMIVVTLVAPTLKMLPTDSRYAKAVVFAIAVGGNLGGMMTPLSSPQNAVTVENINSVAALDGIDAHCSFTEFFATALPFSLICCLLAWGILQIVFKMDIRSVPPVPSTKTDFGWRQIVVSVVSLATIAVWISLPFGGDLVFSDFGIVGFIPVLIFYGSTILPPSRIAELPWNIIFLLMGGNGLSKCVTESGLMQIISDVLRDLLGGTSLWVTLLIVNLCVLVIDFFLTHTVSSMITLPIVTTFAANTGHLVLYGMMACMVTTCSQILPVSSFPNMCCVSLTDNSGRNYVTSNEMIKWGILITVVCVVACMSIYYGIGLAYGM